MVLSPCPRFIFRWFTFSVRHFMMPCNVKAIQRPHNTQEAALDDDSTVTRVSSAHSTETVNQLTIFLIACQIKKIHNISPQITINTMPGQAIAIICDSRVSQAYLQPISVQISLLFNMQLTCVNLTAGSLIFWNYSIAPNGPRESCVFINKKILGSEYWM